MAKIRRRTATYAAAEGIQVHQGAGVLLYAAMDGTSLSSNVLTLYDGTSANDPVVSTWTQDTDFGTTVPVAVYKDGSIVATMATVSANTHRGVPFADGLFVKKSGDTTHAAVVDFVIKPLIKKSINIGGKAATTDVVNVFDGPGILHGIKIRTDASGVLTTADLLFKDTNVIGTGGKTLWTATDYTTAAATVWSATTTTGIDDAGAAVTTGATGAYVNEGICFLSGLQITAAQLASGAGLRAATIDVLIEA